MICVIPDRWLSIKSRPESRIRSRSGNPFLLHVLLVIAQERRRRHAPKLSTGYYRHRGSGGPVVCYMRVSITSGRYDL